MSEAQLFQPVQQTVIVR